MDSQSLYHQRTYMLDEAGATGHARRVLCGETDAFPARNMLYWRQAEWACLHLLPSTATPPSYALISCMGSDSQRTTRCSPPTVCWEPKPPMPLFKFEARVQRALHMRANIEWPIHLVGQTSAAHVRLVLGGSAVALFARRMRHCVCCQAPLNS